MPFYLLQYLTSAVLVLLSASALPLETNDNIVIISDPNDFIELSDDVNNGTSYDGSTVLLANDIDFTGFSEVFNPIGIDPYTNKLFCGKFDGQGHVISNLVMNSTRQFVGLFGVVNGTDFRNAVIDSSCSFSNVYESIENFSYTSGFIAYVFTLEKNSEIVVDSCVNMASAAFSGTYTDKPLSFAVSVSGIVGYILPNNTNFVIKNCANYGQMSFSGSCEMVALGGILGAFFKEEITVRQKCFIRNCANYGNLVSLGTAGFMVLIGGITGVSVRGTIENCVSFGILKTTTESIALGKIVGAGTNYLSINNCFWTTESDINLMCGFNYGDPIITNSSLIEPNATMFAVLNSWVESNSNGESEYSQWAILHLDGGFMGPNDGDTVFALGTFPTLAPTKEGHSFERWRDCENNEYNEISINATEFYAVWRINNYTIIFDFGNGTVLEMILPFNDTIVYPDTKGLKGFHGWNSTLERVPGHDLIVGPGAPPPAKSHAGAIVGGVVGGVVLIVFVVILIVVYTFKSKTWYLKYIGGGRRRRRNNDEIELDDFYSRFVARVGDDDGIVDLDFTVTDSDPDMYVHLYTGEYRIPSITAALVEAGIDRGLASYAEKRCMGSAERAESEGKLFDGFTKEDAACVALYTCDFGGNLFDSNPYRLLNIALMDNNGDSIRSVRGLFFLVMSALRKLPRCSGPTLYRGIRNDIDKDKYKVGKKVVFHGFSSTSVNMATVKAFLASSVDPERGGCSSGTLFVIEDAWGYDIQPYSMFPEEKEILLEPERCFVVNSVIEAETTVVNLKMIDTPPILTQVFGDCKDLTVG